MFSIHCKVLRVGQQKTEGMLVQNRWEKGQQWAWGFTTEIPYSHWETVLLSSVRADESIKSEICSGQITPLTGHALSPLITSDWLVHGAGNVSPYTTWMLGGS